MLIYPDSSDLINLCRGSAWIDISDLAQRLAAHSHRIVLSLDTLIELAAPLRNGYLLEVRKHLNQLEQFPVTFVNEARIYNMEIREALAAFEQAREYNFTAITPFAPRLSDAIDIHGAPLYISEGGMRVPTRMLVNYGIVETMLYLWRHARHIFDVQRRREQWIWVMDNDRAMASPPSLRDHFVTMIIRALATHGIHPPQAGAEPFARWIYESPLRCPGVRLAYETQHRFRRDRTAQPGASDMIDLARITAIPYVDFFVTDAAMMTYCRQAVTDIDMTYPQLVGDLRAVMSHLALA
jgi:hypothetical protein